jgi:enoyl-CoA hydratase/carnithine racemase
MYELASACCRLRVGAGTQAFTAGVDLSAARQVFKNPEEDTDSDIVHQMDQCTMPIIGAINGWAINAGFEMALACDLLLAAPGAVFMDTHCKFGLMPSWGLSQVYLPWSLGLTASKRWQRYIPGTEHLFTRVQRYDRPLLIPLLGVGL